jgi:hypothetical protein
MRPTLALALVALGVGCSDDAARPGDDDVDVADAKTDADGDGDGDGDAPPAPKSCRELLDDGAPSSMWVHYGDDDALVYAPFGDHGDRIMDFSAAGYGGGGVPLPVVPTVESLMPSGGDDTAAIQAAIDRAAAKPLVAGFRGAVELAAGSWSVRGPLRIAASGVVLRGAGSGTDGTVVHVSGTPFRLITIAGAGSPSLGTRTAITDAYVAAGTRTVHVASTAGLAPGDTVMIERPLTAPWIHFLDMDTLVRDNEPQTWLSPGGTIRADRAIAAIDGSEITLDVPLADSIDGAYLAPPGATLAPYTWTGRIAHVGVEHLRVVAPPQGNSLDDPKFQFFTIDNAVDAWIRDIWFQDCVDCSVVGGGAKRVTIADITIQHTGAVDGGALPADFALNGTQTLLLRAASLAARNVYTVVTQARVTGPNVVLDYRSTQQKGVEPHQRWATGLLLDNLDVDGGISLWNRGIYGSGHGWTIAWGVVWNSRADRYLVQRPPGTQNWVIGSSGAITDRARPGRTTPVEPRGAFDSHGTRVSPPSLYRAQLCERLGAAALDAL